MKNTKHISIFLFGVILISILTSCGHSGYEEKDGKIYHKWFHGGNWSKENSLVKEADPASFEEIKNNLNIDLAKDKKHVFINSAILKEADPLTFFQIQDYYWKDQNNVFLLQFGSQRQIVKNADPKSFQLLDQNLWAKDNNHVFYKFDTLPKTNPNTFKIIDKEWGKDGKYFFHHSTPIDSLDYNTAEIVSDFYVKDKYNVYYLNKKVKGANPSTFIPDGIGSFGHDDKFMFDGYENNGAITEQYRKTYIPKK